MKHLYPLLILVLILGCGFNTANAQQLIDVAGDGRAAYNGDNGPALNASLNGPSSLIVTPNNELWIADIDNHRIRAINLTTGMIRTVAGTGTASFSGDGGAALKAGLNKPRDLYYDPKGNIYFTDYGNHRVRKIDLSGIISTVAGNGTTGYSEGANALSTGLPEGGSVTVDPQGNIYITDKILHKILRVDQATKTIRTFAGNGSVFNTGDGGSATNAGIPLPHVVRYATDNSILLSDIESNVVRKISLNTGIIETVVGNGTPGYSGDGGPAKSAQINVPLDLNVDSAGNIYIADGNNHAIRKVDASTGLITTIAGTGEPGYDGANVFYQCSRINVPVSVVWSASGMIYLGEWIGLRIRKIDPALVTPVPPAGRLSALPQEICPDLPFTLSVERLGGFAGDPQIEWLRNGISTGYSGMSASIASANNGDIFSASVIGKNNTCGSDSLLISTRPIVLTNVVEATASIKGDSILCPQENSLFQVQSNYRLKNINWTVNNITRAQGDIFSPTGLADGTVLQFRAQVDTTGCLSGKTVFSRPITIEVLAAPALRVSPADTSIPLGTVVTITAFAEPGISQFNWAGSGVSNSTGNTQTMQPERTAVYTVAVTNASGCTQKAVSRIRVIRPVYIPNSFTPNADGKNDVFRLPPDIDVDLVSFRVFNRFGELVWESLIPGEGWDGHVKGLAAPAGTYAYQLKYKEDKLLVEKKGTVTLIR